MPSRPTRSAPPPSAPPLDEPHVELDGRRIPVRLWESELLVRAAATVLRTQSIAAVLTTVALVLWLLLSPPPHSDFALAGIAAALVLAAGRRLWSRGTRLLKRDECVRRSAIVTLLFWMGLLVILPHTGLGDFHGAAADFPRAIRFAIINPLRWYPSVAALIILLVGQTERAFHPSSGAQDLAPLASVPGQAPTGMAWASFLTALLSLLSVLLYLPCVDAW